MYGAFEAVLVSPLFKAVIDSVLVVPILHTEMSSRTVCCIGTCALKRSKQQKETCFTSAKDITNPV